MAKEIWLLSMLVTIEIKFFSISTDAGMVSAADGTDREQRRWYQDSGQSDPLEIEDDLFFTQRIWYIE
jgi:hypothetical protein